MGSQKSDTTEWLTLSLSFMPMIAFTLVKDERTYKEYGICMHLGRSGPQRDHVCIGKHTGWDFFLPTHAFNVTSEKVSPSSLIRDLLLFSSGRFIVLAVTFRSAIRLEFIFVYDRRKGF